MFFIIVIDGLVVVGKGIIVCVFVWYFGFVYLDIGFLYCVVGVIGGDLVVVVCGFFFVDLECDDLCSFEVGQVVSWVVVIFEVCMVLVEFQCCFVCVELGVVLDGCDIGIVICFEVEVKFYVIVSDIVCVCCCVLELVVDEVLIFVELCECDVCDVVCDVVFLCLVIDVILLDILDLSIEDVLVCVIDYVKVVGV